jgi:hypothetical protein
MTTDIYYLHNVIEKTILENIDIDLYEVLEIIATNFSPEDIFYTDDLIGWALDNGYVKEE